MLAASAFVYIDVIGLSPEAYGAAMGSGSVAYLAGTFLCRRWLLAHGLPGAVKRGAMFTLAGGVSAVVLAMSGVQTVWAVLVPQWLFAFGHGIHLPCGQTGAVGPFPHNAGVASALAGFVLALVAFGIGLWLGQALDGTTRPMAYGMGTWAAVTAGLGVDARAASRGAGGARRGMSVSRVEWIGIAGPTAAGKTAAAMAVARGAARAGGDRERRFRARLPRHGHRHREADARRAGARPASPDRPARPRRKLLRRAVRGRRRRAVRDIRARGRLPLLVGGTMLYFKAVLEGIDAMPAADPAIRAALDAEAAERGWPALHAELSRVDPVTAARVPPSDAQRIQRALEVHRVTGRPLSSFHGGAMREPPRPRPSSRSSPPRAPGCTSASPSASTRCSRPASSTKCARCVRAAT